MERRNFLTRSVAALGGAAAALLNLRPLSAEFVKKEDLLPEDSFDVKCPERVLNNFDQWKHVSILEEGYVREYLVRRDKTYEWRLYCPMGRAQVRAANRRIWNMEHCQAPYYTVGGNASYPVVCRQEDHEYGLSDQSSVFLLYQCQLTPDGKNLVEPCHPILFASR